MRTKRQLEAFRKSRELRHPPKSDEYYIARLKSKMQVDANGCWVWQGYRHKPPRDYGEMSYRGKTWRTHRLMYRLIHGPIPSGFVVCHKCDNTGCINPDHLWLGTHHQNMSDCRAKDRYHYANLTHCKRGHPFTPENTGHHRPDARHLRCCKVCQRGYQRMKAGWPEDLAFSAPPTPKGKRPFGKSWAAVRGRATSQQTSTVAVATDQPSASATPESRDLAR